MLLKAVKYLFFYTPKTEPGLGVFALVELRQILNAYATIIIVSIIIFLFKLDLSSDGFKFVSVAIFVFYEELSRWSFCHNATNKYSSAFLFAIYISFLELILYSSVIIKSFELGMFSSSDKSISYIILSYFTIRFVGFVMHALCSLLCAISYEMRRSFMLVIFTLSFVIHYFYDINIGSISTKIFGI